MKRLTIAIPFHKGLDYLKLAIESVLGQSREDWQLLVSDDGSPEQGAGELAASYRDDRIEYHRNERNLGMVANWNQCIERASTDLLTLLHGDDLLLPGYTATMLDLADEHPDAAALFCDVVIIDGRGHKRGTLADSVKQIFVPRGSEPILLRGEAGLERIMRGNFIACPTLCFRKSRLRDRRFSARWKQVQDLEFTSRLLMEGDTLIGSRSVCYAYRRHPDAMTALQSASLVRFDEEFELFGLVATEAQKLGWMRAARVSRSATIVKLHLLYRAIRDLVTLRPRSALRKLRMLDHGS